MQKSKLGFWAVQISCEHNFLIKYLIYAFLTLCYTSKANEAYTRNKFKWLTFLGRTEGLYNLLNNGLTNIENSKLFVLS